MNLVYTSNPKESRKVYYGRSRRMFINWAAGVKRVSDAPYVRRYLNKSGPTYFKHNVENLSKVKGSLSKYPHTECKSIVIWALT
jgi:hypothetical protein